MTLLALQFGLQPILTKTFAKEGIIKSTYVFLQDLTRLFSCLVILLMTGSFQSATAGWSLAGCMSAAGLPSMLYVLQNYMSLTAYQNLPPITYNVLNQTKTLSAALCCFLLLGQLQSQLQIASLVVLLVSALVMENVIPLSLLSPRQQSPSKASEAVQSLHWKKGVIPLLVASLTSGLAGALVQKSTQLQARNSLLLSIELAFFSSMTLLATLVLGTRDSQRIREEGAFSNWTAQTWIPLITNAAGGIIVGLVTKYAGSVRKGFALILGMFLSGLVQNAVTKEKVSARHWVGGMLAALSLWMHSVGPLR